MCLFDEYNKNGRIACKRILLSSLPGSRWRRVVGKKQWHTHHLSHPLQLYPQSSPTRNPIGNRLFLLLYSPYASQQWVSLCPTTTPTLQFSTGYYSSTKKCVSVSKRDTSKWHCSKKKKKVSNITKVRLSTHGNTYVKKWA